MGAGCATCAEFDLLALLADSTLFWLAVSGLVVLAYILTKQRARALAESWAENEDETPGKEEEDAV